MKLSFAVTAIAAMLGVAEAAPRIEIRVQPGFFNTQTTVFHASGEKTNLGFFVDNCRSNVGNMRQVCVDSGRKRAHVTYKDGYKRCFRQSRAWAPPNCPGCMNFDFSQSACNW